MGNYIHSLEDQLREARAELCGLKSGIHDLFCYLESDKFSHDNSVNRNDVVLRLQAAESLSEDLRQDQANMNYRARQDSARAEVRTDCQAGTRRVL